MLNRGQILHLQHVQFERKPETDERLVDEHMKEENSMSDILMDWAGEDVNRDSFACGHGMPGGKRKRKNLVMHTLTRFGRG